MDQLLMNAFWSEILGTATLILLGAGAGAHVGLPRTQGVPGGWLRRNFGWGLAVFAGVYVAYKSGAHLNPAVTIGLFTAQEPFFSATGPEGLVTATIEPTVGIRSGCVGAQRSGASGGAGGAAPRDVAGRAGGRAPVEVRDAEAHGDAARDLLGLVVAHGRALRDGTRARDGARTVEERLGERGLARAALPDAGDVGGRGRAPTLRSRRPARPPRDGPPARAGALTAEQRLRARGRARAAVPDEGDVAGRGRAGGRRRRGHGCLLAAAGRRVPPGFQASDVERIVPGPAVPARAGGYRWASGGPRRGAGPRARSAVVGPGPLSCAQTLGAGPRARFSGSRRPSSS